MFQASAVEDLDACVKTNGFIRRVCGFRDWPN